MAVSDCSASANHVRGKLRFGFDADFELTLRARSGSAAEAAGDDGAGGAEPGAAVARVAVAGATAADAEDATGADLEVSGRPVEGGTTGESRDAAKRAAERARPALAAVLRGLHAAMAERVGSGG